MYPTIGMKLHSNLKAFCDKYAEIKFRPPIQEQVASLSSFVHRYSDLRARATAPMPSLRQLAPLPEFCKMFEYLNSACVAARHTENITNIWSIAGLKRDEVRTTAVLAWILNPRQSHGFGRKVLDRLIADASNVYPSDNLDQLDLGDCEVRTEFCAFGAADNRIDIAIVGINCVIFIEVKIDAPEGEQQLDRYNRIAAHRAAFANKKFSKVFYLTLHKPLKLPEGIVSLRWGDIARAVNSVTDSIEVRKSFSGRVLRQFAEHILHLTRR